MRRRGRDAAAHTTSAADGWRLGVRTEEVRERVGERYKRETLTGLAQIKLAQSKVHLIGRFIATNRR